MACAKHFAGYGAADGGRDYDPVYLSEFKKNYKIKDQAEKPVINRLPLHALRLSFREPTEDKTVVVEAPLPKDFSRMLKYLRKYQPQEQGLPTRS